MKILMQNSTKLPNVVPHVRSVQAEREHGFLAATFCPIPIGDSPSSKRMYDVLNFGCIPVVLSDDLVWAYSIQTGGPLSQLEFSIQIPQSIVHFTAQRSLRQYETSPRDMGVLPASGKLIFDLLKASVQNGGDYWKGHYVNPLVQILQNIPRSDIDYLQKAVATAAPHFRYYKMDATLTAIPTAQHRFPDGGAMEMIANRLSQRKSAGIDSVSKRCQRERLDRKHKYIGRYVCEGRDKTDSLVRRRKRR